MGFRDSRTLLANGADVKVVAHSELKVDALALACGRPMFVDDVKFAGTLTAKILATEAAVRHTSEMVQVLAGYGISREYPVEKYARDAKLLPIMDGTNETLMLKVAALM